MVSSDAALAATINGVHPSLPGCIGDSDDGDDDIDNDEDDEDHDSHAALQGNSWKYEQVVSHLVWAASAFLNQDPHHLVMVVFGSHVDWK